MPATIFVSTNYVMSGKRYWWDTVYYERRRRGSTDDAIAREIAFLEMRKPERIHDYLLREFGTNANASDRSRSTFHAGGVEEISVGRADHGRESHHGSCHPPVAEPRTDS